MSKFWITRPVVHARAELGNPSGVVDTEAATREENDSSVPTQLPVQLEWARINMSDPEQLTEVGTFLQKHYRDLDGQPQVYFTEGFIKWFYYRPYAAFSMPMGWTPSAWAVGLRSTLGKKPLVGFHGAMPIHVRYHDAEMDVATSNFLCVHSKMRGKGVAPLLIKELSRVLGRFRVGGVFSIGGPGPASCVPFCTFNAMWRPINLCALAEAGMWAPKSRVSQKSLRRLYAVPSATNLFRKMELSDVPVCMSILKRDSAKYRVAMWCTTIEEFVHHFCTEAESFVLLEGESVIDFFAYMPLVIRSGQHRLTMAQIMHITTDKTPILESGKALIAAARATDLVGSYGHFGIDRVWNELGFESGNFQSSYYNYNYLCPSTDPEDVSLVLV